MEKCFLLEENDPYDKYPMVSTRNESSRFLGLTEPIDEYERFEFKFIKPYGARSKMADHHYDRKLFLSKKVVDVLKGFDLFNVDYLDASLTDNKGNTNYDYYVLHIRNHIECFDKKRSAWTPPTFDPNEVMSIELMCLDMDRLNAIPLEKRRLFRLKESTYYALYHESVVDEILATNPTNIRFVSVDAWHSDISWQL